MIVILWRQYGQDVACRALLRRHTWNTPIAHFSCQTLDLFPMLPPLVCSCHNRCVHNWSQGQELPEYQANQTINIWNHNYFLTNFKAYNLKNKRNLSKADGTVMVAWSGSPWEFIFIFSFVKISILLQIITICGRDLGAVKSPRLGYQCEHVPHLKVTQH